MFKVSPSLAVLVCSVILAVDAAGEQTGGSELVFGDEQTGGGSTDGLNFDSKLAALQAKCDACKTAEDALIALLKRAVTEHADAQAKKDAMDEAETKYNAAKAAYDGPKATAEATDGEIDAATAKRDADCAV